MKKREHSDIPQFESLEEERQYWEARGPLAEGRKGQVNKPKPREKRSSFLAVRLTGEELTRLRDMAARQGVGPSTYARLVLTRAIEHEGKPARAVGSDELMSRLTETLSKTDRKDLAKVDADNPVLLVFSGEGTKWEDFAPVFLRRLLELLGIQVITTEHGSYERLKETVKSRT